MAEQNTPDHNDRKGPVRKFAGETIFLPLICAVGTPENNVIFHLPHPKADCDDDVDMSASTPTKVPAGNAATAAVSEKRNRDERRRSQRKPYVAEASLASPTAKDPADRLEVSALNISRHGIAFELPKSIPTGAFYVLQLGMGPQRMTTEVQIISCRSGNGTFHVGAKFC